MPLCEYTIHVEMLADGRSLFTLRSAPTDRGTQSHTTRLFLQTLFVLCPQRLPKKIANDRRSIPTLPLLAQGYTRNERETQYAISQSSCLQDRPQKQKMQNEPNPTYE